MSAASEARRVALASLGYVVRQPHRGQEWIASLYGRSVGGVYLSEEDAWERASAHAYEAIGAMAAAHAATPKDPIA